MNLTVSLSYVALLLYLSVAIALYLPPRRYTFTSVWWLYCLTFSPISHFYYANWSPPHPIPAWIYPVGMIGRVAITVEAVMLLLWVIPPLSYQRRRMWAVSLGAGVGIWGLSVYTGLSMIGRVRIGCFVIMLVLLGTWMWGYFHTWPFARRHFALMSVYLSTSALASAFGSVRGDWMDSLALIVQIATLSGWCYLAQRRDL